MKYSRVLTTFAIALVSGLLCTLPISNYFYLLIPGLIFGISTSLASSLVNRPSAPKALIRFVAFTFVAIIGFHFFFWCVVDLTREGGSKIGVTYNIAQWIRGTIGGFALGILATLGFHFLHLGRHTITSGLTIITISSAIGSLVYFSQLHWGLFSHGISHLEPFYVAFFTITLTALVGLSKPYTDRLPKNMSL